MKTHIDMRDQSNLVKGTVALTKLRQKLSVQHGEETFNEAMKLARMEGDLLASVTKIRKQNKFFEQD